MQVFGMLGVQPEPGHAVSVYELTSWGLLSKMEVRRAAMRCALTQCLL